ncbi:hypothetical protein D9M68_926390 [compost metagenome]
MVGVFQGISFLFVVLVPVGADQLKGLIVQIKAFVGVKPKPPESESVGGLFPNPARLFIFYGSFYPV